MATPSNLDTLSNRSEEDTIYALNSYAEHPDLSPTEAEVLWELAKLNQRVKDVGSDLS
jgi:hypothetical protein